MARMQPKGLEWCIRCAKWRSHLNPKTGWCGICSILDRLAKSEQRCLEEMEEMDPESRLLYENTEAKRAPLKRPPRPRLRDMEGSCPEDRERALALACEEWESKNATLLLDASKQRLRRMRERSRRNPQKGK